jgi:hypothetical protein
LTDFTKSVTAHVRKEDFVEKHNVRGVGVEGKNKRYHCSFCAKYPDLVQSGIKKIYIFDDFQASNERNTSHIGYYQCIDMDTNYAQ